MLTYVFVYIYTLDVLGQSLIGPGLVNSLGWLASELLDPPGSASLALGLQHVLPLHLAFFFFL